MTYPTLTQELERSARLKIGDQWYMPLEDLEAKLKRVFNDRELHLACKYAPLIVGGPVDEVYTYYIASYQDALQTRTK